MDITSPAIHGQQALFRASVCRGAEAARLAAIPATNKLLAQLRDLFAPVPHNGRIPDQQRDRALQAIVEGGSTDIATIGAAVLFSGRTAATFDELKRQRQWYNNIPQNSYNAEGYLDGLEVVREDWRTLYDRHGGSRTLFVCDPPCLTTQANNYKGGRYWPLTAYLDILLALRGARFIYFTSGKSQLVELCSWLARHTDIDALAGAEVVKRNNIVRPGAEYTDIMIFN